MNIDKLKATLKIFIMWWIGIFVVVSGVSLLHWLIEHNPLLFLFALVTVFAIVATLVIGPEHPPK